MSRSDSSRTGRRSLLSGLGMAAVAGAALGSSAAQAQTKSPKFEPRRHELDAWMEAIPGDHRVFIDTDSTAGATNALRYATNILNAQVNAYKGADKDMAIIICLRHASTILGFNDAMWAKYGSSLNSMSAMMSGRPLAPAAPAGQPAAAPGGSAPTAAPPAAAAAPAPTTNAQSRAIATAAGRGVHFAICDTATNALAGMIARPAGLKVGDVHAELIANIVPNGHMVPAGVMALTRAQEHGYSFLYSSA
jgi:intracellular sulfur oxidation DsrE/DsrF family protein